MNPLIREQLLKVRRVDLSDAPDTVTRIEIDKIDLKSLKICEKDTCYIIQVEDYILKPPEGFTLHSNWNNNVIPKSKYMKVEVLQIMGKMIKVNSLGYNPKTNETTGDAWVGWLPEKSIKIIERL